MWTFKQRLCMQVVAAWLDYSTYFPLTLHEQIIILTQTSYSTVEQQFIRDTDVQSLQSPRCRLCDLGQPDVCVAEAQAVLACVH